MFKSKSLVVLFGVALMSLVVECRADYIRFTATGTVDQFGPTNTAGLDGATFTFSAQFDLPNTYTSIMGYPSVVGMNPTITISGATESARNGTFTVSNGVAFLPNAARTGAVAADGTVMTASLGGADINLNLFTDPTTAGSTKLIGESIEVADFGRPPYPIMPPLTHWVATNTDSRIPR